MLQLQATVARVDLLQDEAIKDLPERRKSRMKRRKKQHRKIQVCELADYLSDLSNFAFNVS